MRLAFPVVWIVALALVTWCVSTTIAQAKVFKPLRDWIMPHWMQDELDEYMFLYSTWMKVRLVAWELVSCQRCLAHYVAALAVWLFPFTLIEAKYSLATWVANWFLVVAVNDVIARKLEKRFSRVNFTQTLRRGN